MLCRFRARNNVLVVFESRSSLKSIKGLKYENTQSFDLIKSKITLSTGQIQKSSSLAYFSFLIYSRQGHRQEHKLAWEGVGEEEYTQGVEEERSMVEDRSSYNDEHRSGDKEAGVEPGDRGIRVLREVPLAPLVPCIRGYRGIRGIREGREVPCILVVRGVLAVGMGLA